LWSRANPIFGSRTTSAETGLLLQAVLAGLVLQQMTVALLAVPAFAAGSISDEKITGTLEHLLATPLESRHIIVGKWLAQLIQSIVLPLPTTPLICPAAASVGLPWPGLTTLVLLPLIPLPALDAASLVSSVWARHTISAIAWLYAVLGLTTLLAWGLGAMGS